MALARSSTSMLTSIVAVIGWLAPMPTGIGKGARLTRYVRKHSNHHTGPSQAADSRGGGEIRATVLRVQAGAPGRIDIDLGDVAARPRQQLRIHHLEPQPRNRGE